MYRVHGCWLLKLLQIYNKLHVFVTDGSSVFERVHRGAGCPLAKYHTAGRHAHLLVRRIVLVSLIPKINPDIFWATWYHTHTAELT